MSKTFVLEVFTYNYDSFWTEMIAVSKNKDTLIRKMNEHYSSVLQERLSGIESEDYMHSGIVKHASIEDYTISEVDEI